MCLPGSTFPSSLQWTLVVSRVAQLGWNLCSEHSSPHISPQVEHFDVAEAESSSSGEDEEWGPRMLPDAPLPRKGKSMPPLVTEAFYQVWDSFPPETHTGNVAGPTKTRVLIDALLLSNRFLFKESRGPPNWCIFVVWFPFRTAPTFWGFPKKTTHPMAMNFDREARLKCVDI